MQQQECSTSEHTEVEENALDEELQQLRRKIAAVSLPYRLVYQRTVGNGARAERDRRAAK
eukprot:1027448-Prorocentrum_minimum.AAC.2